MAATPSPLDRLLQLERDVEQLQVHTARPAPPQQPPSASPSRRPWPVDELLLTRLLRRSPEALAAYQAPAELTATTQRGLRLSVAESASVFQFCELIGGDAVVWVQADSPAWVWDSETFQRIFPTALESEGQQDLVLQMLPIFKPVVRGQAGHCSAQVRWCPQSSIPRAGEADDAVATTGEP